jgi:hypothetical protein
MRTGAEQKDRLYWSLGSRRISMVIELIVGGVVAAGTYLFAKKKKVSKGTSAAAAAVTGTGAAAVAALVFGPLFWPVLVLGGAATGGWFYAKRKNMKALPAGRDA